MAADAQSVIRELEESRLLQGVSREDVEKLAAIGTIEQYGSSTVLFQEGSDCRQLSLVIDGLIGLDMCMPRRGCIRILTVGPQELLGWSAMVPNARMTARATVIEPCTLVTFPANQLRALCDADHDVGYVVMSHLSAALSQRLLATRLQMLDMFGETQPVAAPSGNPASGRNT